MIRLLIPALVVLTASGLVLADSGERLPSLKQLCISDQGTGFNWKKGSWIEVSFTEEKFIVTKIKPPPITYNLQEINTETLSAMIACTQHTYESDEMSLENMKGYHSCLKLQELGEEYSEHLACWESHFRKEGSNDWDVRFECYGGFTSFNMQVNGHFHKGRVHAVVTPKPINDYKDSLSIFIGKCANIAD